MNQILLLFLLFTTALSLNQGHTDSIWYRVNQTRDSFQPPFRASSHFLAKNSTHTILYGGFFERITTKPLDNVFNNDIFVLDATDPNQIRWQKIIPDPRFPLPGGRALECAVYSVDLDSLYIFGGVSYKTNYTDVVLNQDCWYFNFSINRWRLLDNAAVPGQLAGMGCDIIENDAIMTHGFRLNGISNSDETWIWHLLTNTWSWLPVSKLRPVGRYQFYWKHIPSTKKIIMINGLNNFGSLTNNYLSDIWIFDLNTETWEQILMQNVPQSIHSTPAYVLLSDKMLLITGGDVGLANITLDDSCRSPLECYALANPSNTNFFLEINADKSEALWKNAAFNCYIPSVTRHSMIWIKPYVYLVGGIGWNGKYGVGEIYNPYTWAIRLDF